MSEEWARSRNGAKLFSDVGRIADALERMVVACAHPLDARRSLDGRTMSPTKDVIALEWQWCSTCGALRDRDGLLHYPSPRR